ncbi:phosphoglycerate mutase [Hylemonella sp. W303a]|uniref:phosphoglycerate mutase n=1 Tax=Hylemonella sp. W303a TaxID=3389873 RepID=UPI00396B1D7B
MPSQQLLIPHALVDDAEAAPAARAALSTAFKNGLLLPGLQSHLDRVTPRTRRLDAQGVVGADEDVLARAQGLDPETPPWAALRARALGLPNASAMAWAFLTPAHWVLPQGVGQTQVSLSDPGQLRLNEAEARALCAAMQPYFSEDGLTLHIDTPAQWLVCGAPLQGLRSPAPERVLALGGDVAPWLPSTSPGAPLLRRLQNEMQMLLYTHAANDARESRGLPSVNSFWLHGCGALGAAPEPQNDWTVLEFLREPALRGYTQGDWRAWADAWRELDARLQATTQAQTTPPGLVLCGLHTIVTLEHAERPSRGLWRRLRRRLQPNRQNAALAAFLCPA